MNDEEQLEHEVTPPTAEEKQQLEKHYFAPAVEALEQARLREEHEAWLEMKRQEPVEATSDAELKAFDAQARQRFEAQLVRERYTEPRPGSSEAEAAVRDAIRQGK